MPKVQKQDGIWYKSEGKCTKPHLALHIYIYIYIFFSFNEDVGPIATIFKIEDIHTAVQGLSHAI